MPGILMRPTCVQSLLLGSTDLARRVLYLLIFLTVLTVVKTPGQTNCSTPSFRAARNFAAGTNPSALVTGDFTGDGETDVAVANAGSPFISVFLGSGTGNLAPVKNIPLGARSLAAADFNGDGNLDLASADFVNIHVLLGDGFGGFGPPFTLNAGANPTVVVTSDFNSDGRPDIAALNSNSANISVFLNNANGGFTQASNFVARPAPGSFAMADFNNDGRQDFVVVTTSANITNNATLLLGNGSGGFQPPIFFDVGPATSVLAGEFNNDGKIDLIVTQFFSVRLLFGNGSGGFGSPVAVHSQLGIIGSGDLNKDSKTDLIGVINNNLQVLFGNGAGSFTPSPVLYGDGDPVSAASGNFNDDAQTDIVVVNRSSNNVSIILGNGGGFVGPDSYDIKATSVRSGDFNNDGRPDLVAAISDASTKKIRVFIGGAGENFPSSIDFLLSETPSSLSVSDFNGDGKLDVAFSNLSLKGVTVLLGNGSGGFFERQHTPTSETLTFLLAGDFNNDGKTDIAALTQFPHQVSVLLGNGAGTFTSMWSSSFDGIPVWIANGDLNGDGTIDMVITTGSADAVRVFLGQGSGMFAFVGSLKVGTSPTGITLADFNGDSKQDIAVTPSDGNKVAILLGNGTGAFASPQNFDVGIAPNTVVAGDLNGDGRLDLVVGNSGQSDLSLLLGDGTGKFSFAMNLGTANTPWPLLMGDLNGDGRPEIVALSSATGVINVFWSKSCVSSFGMNQIDISKIFVRQHYLDFLNREPDAAGLAYWSNSITECQRPGATCSAEVSRINVSGAFFLSIEFQETGYLVERLYKTAYGDAIGTSTLGGSHQLSVPIIRLNEFLPDSQEIGRGLVVGAPGWEQLLEANKVAFTQAFVQRSRFTTAFPASLTPTQFVDLLFANAGFTPTAAERAAAIGQFGGAPTSADVTARARTVRSIAESESLNQIEKNRAFVLMQYFGYLRRNPNDPQDTDYTGYDFWLTKLNDFKGNYIEAEMVKAFIDSGEYRHRFGP